MLGFFPKNVQIFWRFLKNLSENIFFQRYFGKIFFSKKIYFKKIIEKYIFFKYEF